MPPASIDSGDLPRLLKRLYRFREQQARGTWLAALLARRRKAALVAAFARQWPGGYVLTDAGETAFVPAPLDSQGQRVLFYGFRAPPAALGLVPPGGVAIDVGANLGEWSVPLARAVGPAGRVLCCEPNPAAAAALAATLRINNLAQARLVEVGLSDADGEGRLTVDPAHTGLSRLAACGEGVAVRLQRLDTLVAQHGLDRLDLLKIDVEGHEHAVFSGAIVTLRRLRPAVVFESGHEGDADRRVIADRLDAADYEIVAVLHDYGALACDLDDYRAARGASGGREAHNLLALPRKAAR